MNQLSRVGARSLLGGFLAILSIAVIAGCSKSDTSTTTGGTSASPGGDKIKIGFIVKQPEETWFQTEWKFAQQAADEDGFTLVTMDGADGDKVMTDIDNLAAQGAKGFVICTPDVRLGPAIAAKAAQDNLKFMTVDDRLIGSDGNFMQDVHHLGISAHNIGLMVGNALFDEMTKRGWSPADTALCCITFKELDTARQRTDGAVEALTTKGFPKEKVYEAPQKTSDTPGGLDAALVCLTQHPEVKHWMICGMNDNTVLGGVRATENRGFAPADVLAIGINGIDAVNEFEKDQPTGFFASVLNSARRHGHDTADYMYKWIHDGVEPPPLTYTTGVLISRDNFKQIMTDQGVMTK
jgi:L-arabinose transport system substrate-binding protein